MSQPSIEVAERRRERPSDNVPRRPAAVGVICDLVEENWPSMDLVGQMLLDHLQQNHAGDLQAVRLCPPMVRRYSALPFSSRNRKAYNLDRLVNRFWMYPRWLRRRVDDFEIFHLVDHSYSQLIHELPAERTLVTCHDLEAFRGALTPGKGIASSLRQLMAQRILSGFRKAAHVTCDSQAIKDELLSYNLIPAERATVVANGFHPSRSPKPNAEADLAIERLLGPRGEGPELLNVGTTVARKRIDILLQVFAEVRRQVPNAKLIRVGGEFTAAQSRLIDRLGISASISIPVCAEIFADAVMTIRSCEAGISKFTSQCVIGSG